MRKFLPSFVLLYLVLALASPSLVFAIHGPDRHDQDVIGNTIPLISPLTEGQTSFAGGAPGALGNYINNLYFTAIGFAALLAMGVIIFGAIRYMAEAGKPFMQSDAKVWIFVPQHRTSDRWDALVAWLSEAEHENSQNARLRKAKLRIAQHQKSLTESIKA